MQHKIDQKLLAWSEAYRRVREAQERLNAAEKLNPGECEELRSEVARLEAAAERSLTEMQKEFDALPRPSRSSFS